MKNLYQPLTKPQIERIALARIKGHRVYLPKLLNGDDHHRIEHKTAQLIRKLTPQ